MKRFFLFLALAVLVSGCAPERDEPGVVATVNGRPITLSRLEFVHALKQMGAPGLQNPTVEQLRGEYGDILADMILLELIAQELDDRGLSVTDQDVADVEAEVRRDYPDDAFDAMLIEENIDLDRWREGVRSKLAAERFFRDVLAAGSKVGVQEAAEYYKAHSREFVRPERVRFLLVRAKDRKGTQKLLNQYKKQGGLETGDRDGGSVVRELSLRPESLPPAWKKALKGLKPGKASKIGSGGGGAEALVLLERIPEKSLDAAQAYPLVQKALVAQKAREAFAGWVREATKNARIKVSSRLIDSGREARTADRDGEAESVNGGVSVPESPTAALGDGAMPSNRAGGVEEQVRKTIRAKMEGAQEEDAPQTDAATDAADRIVAAEALAGKTRETSKKASQPEAAPSDASRGKPDKAARGAEEKRASSADASPETVKDAPPADAKAASPDKSPDASEATAEKSAQTSTAAPKDVSKTEKEHGDPPPAVVEDGAVPAADKTAEQEKTPKSVTFKANEASWLLLTADGGKMEKMYLKRGKTHEAKFSGKLKARFGSPCDVTWRFGDREERVVGSPSEVKIVEFP